MAEAQAGFEQPDEMRVLALEVRHRDRGVDQNFHGAIRAARACALGGNSAALRTAQVDDESLIGQCNPVLDQRIVRGHRQIIELIAIIEIIEIIQYHGSSDSRRSYGEHDDPRS
jgi:hypothetical protein